MLHTGRLIRVQGRVQGVGFRPFVWRLAHESGVGGRVRNNGTGVSIEAWGPDDALERFVACLLEAPPALARVRSVDWTPLDGNVPVAGFQILPSDGGTVSTEIAPDAAMCADCRSDISDPQNRRFRYPFTNCTHCGPRMSIVEGVPYDRATTTMGAFEMCEQCRREYDDPGDRRFHAQANACPACGPRLWLAGPEGEIDCSDPLEQAAELLRDGAILAIKGIGGFHLACDAANAGAVAELRRRKNRPAKPLAIMARDLEQIRCYCAVSDEEADLLTSPPAPIVLLRNLANTSLPGVAPGLGVTGVMLPYSPLHHLLMEEFEGPLVLTSGNLSDTPQITDNAQALDALSITVDAWLLHDRDIVNRVDDSVMRVDLGAPFALRRGRGLAPEAIALSDGFADAAPTLALGAELKSSFCLLKEGRAIPSQHIGDLKSGETFADFRQKIGLFRDLFRFDPETIVVDCHPDYLSTRWGHALARDTGAELVTVQHHHAHLASCLAEHRIPPDEDRAVGIILDGTGYGLDGTVWGGEILLGGYGDFARKAHLETTPLPGGEQAVREPWRNTLSHLWTVFGADWRSALGGSDLNDRLAAKPVELVTQMIEQGLNSPTSSSAGRLFDAVAGALGVRFDTQHYEGQAAMELEAVARSQMQTAGKYPGGTTEDRTILLEPLWAALARDLKSGVDPGVIAARFHNGLISVLAETASEIASDEDTSRIVLSGGAMQNSLLLGGLHERLTSQGLEVLVHRQVPANDGGLSLGQASIAARC